MSSALVEADHSADEGEFDVLTTDIDTHRAALRARGVLNAASAPVLSEVIAGHLRARRRFLRLDVGALLITDAESLQMLRGAHHDALRARGTLILTGVGDAMRRTLAEAGLDRELFLIAPSAHEQLPPLG